jgi:hypothetical protein
MQIEKFSPKAMAALKRLRAEADERGAACASTMVESMRVGDATATAKAALDLQRLAKVASLLDQAIALGGLPVREQKASAPATAAAVRPLIKSGFGPDQPFALAHAAWRA